MENAEMNPSEMLKLNPQELEVVSNPSLALEPEIDDIPKVIYGRMLGGKSVNKAGLKKLFESLWQNKSGMKIEDYTDGIVTLYFESEAIKNRILRGQPWHFDGNYLILIEADAMDQISAELFQKIPFWVQVHGIPPGYLVKPYGERLGKEIANSIGDFMEFDPNYRRSFMRIRTKMDSSRPLLRGKFLNLGKQKDNIWVSFRYERLSKFCYFCGHLDHIQKDCAVLVEELERGHRPTLQYNDSLKTNGLACVTASEVNVIPRSDKKSIGQMAMEAPQVCLKVPTTDHDTKRLKIGITKDNRGDVEFVQKEYQEGASKSTPISTKNSLKAKANSPTWKQTGRGQNDLSKK